MATLPIQVKQEMAKNVHRMSHYLWHGVRNSWESLNQQQRNAIRAIDPLWEPLRPAVDRNRNVMRDNNSGEDFLYMHREMINYANQILNTVNDINYPRIVGWISLPEPNDTEFPIIPIQGFEGVKSDAYLNSTLRTWENQYKDQNYLSSVTLGQLGADIEFTIHNDMHMRWATPTGPGVGYRPRTPITQKVDSRWDNINYDFLGDTYSSHVHSTFWKIHGWVDDRIEDWKRINNVDSINWIGTWIGPMANTHEGHHHALKEKSFRRVKDNAESNDKMIEVSKILSSVNFNGFIQFK